MPKITSKVKSPTIVLDWKATPEESIAEVNKALAQAMSGLEFRPRRSGGDCYAFALCRKHKTVA